MRKIKWAIDVIKSTTDPAEKLAAYKSIFQVAEKRFDSVEDRIAKPMLFIILEVKKEFNEIPQEYKELLAKSHYMLAEIIVRSPDSDIDAIKHLDNAVKLLPNFEEALRLRKSIQFENNFFRSESGVKQNQ